MPMELGLHDVHVLITGASGGIGLETTRLFLSQGARVTAHYNTNVATLDDLCHEFKPARIQTKQASLGCEEDVIRLFSSPASDPGPNFGPVQVVIVNHGIWPSADVPLSGMTLEQWNSTINANLTSSFLVIREYLRQLQVASETLKDKAAIVLVGSTAGKYGEAGHADYAASKSALMYGLTLSLKNEIVKIAPKGRVNCVAPGWVKTPMAAEALKDPRLVYQSLATTPLQKLAVPHDVATQIVLLSSGVVSGHVTGQVIMIEGGMEGRLLNMPEDFSLV